MRMRAEPSHSEPQLRGFEEWAPPQGAEGHLPATRRQVSRTEGPIAAARNHMPDNLKTMSSAQNPPCHCHESRSSCGHLGVQGMP